MSKVESAETLIADANSYFVDEDYDTALAKFNEAIELDNTNSDYYAKRSFCHYKLDNFTDAMADAKKGIALDQQNPRAYFRKGMAAFSLEEFESAKEAFQNAQRVAPSSQHKTWIRKCDAELADDKDGSGESSEDMDIVKPQQAAQQAAQFDGPPPLEPDVTTKPSQKSHVDGPPPLEPDVPLHATKPSPAPQPTQTQSKVRYEWYQTETHISVSIFLKNVKKEDANITIKPESLSVEVKLPTTESEYQLNITLSDRVVPEESTTSILGSKIEIKMKKTRPAKWPSLENSGGQIQSWDIVADQKKKKDFHILPPPNTVQKIGTHFPGNNLKSNWREKPR